MTVFVPSLIRRLWDLIFDMDDTFWACNIFYRQADHNCLVIIQEALGMPLDIQRCIVHARQVQRATLRRWGFDLNIFENAWVETYYQLAQRHGRRPDPAVAQLVYTTASAVKDAPYVVYDGVIDTLTDLRQRRHRLHVLSLGDETFQLSKLERNGMTELFNTRHIIQRSKGLKMRLLGSDGQPAMMIGDSLHSDIAPAVKLGLEAAWVHSTDPWGQTDKPIDLSRVHVIRHVRELPAILAHYD
ncbi:MAG: HAD family hydrolase [Candidatus Kerfeldbacteria bacterium]|nr:HAD family hydrolase [Candidatus Kerfeldbacteria bacterium]